MLLPRPLPASFPTPSSHQKDILSFLWSSSFLEARIGKSRASFPFPSVAIKPSYELINTCVTDGSKRPSGLGIQRQKLRASLCPRLSHRGCVRAHGCLISIPQPLCLRSQSTLCLPPPCPVPPVTSTAGVPMLPLKGESVPSVDTLPFPVSKVVGALSCLQLAGGPIFPHCVHLGSKDETFPGNSTSQCA